MVATQSVMVRGTISNVFLADKEGGTDSGDLAGMAIKAVRKHHHLRLYAISITIPTPIGSPTRNMNGHHLFTEV